MRPAICDGDLITVDPVDRPCLAPGAVILYRRLNRLFAHRLVGIQRDPSGEAVFICRGDAADASDPPVAAAQILGEVRSVRCAPVCDEARAVRPRVLRTPSVTLRRMAALLMGSSNLALACRTQAGGGSSAA